MVRGRRPPAAWGGSWAYMSVHESPLGHLTELASRIIGPFAHGGEPSLRPLAPAHRRDEIWPTRWFPRPEQGAWPSRSKHLANHAREVHIVYWQTPPARARRRRGGRTWNGSGCFSDVSECRNQLREAMRNPTQPPPSHRRSDLIGDIGGGSVRKSKLRPRSVRMIVGERISQFSLRVVAISAAAGPATRFQPVCE